MPITYLIVAHFLADFTFQPNRLLKMKYASAFGTFVHVSIFALIAVILLVPYLNFWQTWAVIGGVSMVHFITDISKINLSRKSKAYVLPFLLDQMVHLLSIIAGGLVLTQLDVTFTVGSLYLNNFIWLGVLSAIYILFVIDILFIQKRDSKKMINAKLIAFTIGFLIYAAAAILI